MNNNVAYNRMEVNTLTAKQSKCNELKSESIVLFYLIFELFFNIFSQNLSKELYFT